MENSNNISSATLFPITDPLPAQFVAPNTPNPSEFTTTNMEPQNLDRHTNIIPTPRGGQREHTAINIEPEDESTLPFPIPNPLRLRARFQSYSGILYLVYAGTLLYMFPSLIELVGLKFQNKAQSPFETDALLANMAVVAYIIAIPMPVALFCLEARLAGESCSPIYYRILQCLVCFWSLLAPLSFMLVLFMPHGFGFIEYIIVFTLFIVVVACSFSNYIKLHCKKNASNLEAHERNETWSHSITITED